MDKLDNTRAVKVYIEQFMARYTQHLLSGSLGEVGAWQTHLSKEQLEQLMKELLGRGVNVGCLRDKETNQPHGRHFVTFHTNDTDLRGDRGYESMMTNFNQNTYVDFQLAE